MAFTRSSVTAKRFLGASLLLPVVLAVFFGQPSAGIMLFLLGVGMAFEISKMLRQRLSHSVVTMLLISLCAVPYSIIGVEPPLVFGVGISALAAGMVFLTATPLAAGFTFLLCVCLLCSAMLLSIPDGHITLLVLAAVITACDSFAYFTGRFFGGPKLMPKVSPNKTISGSLGGIAASVGAIMACGSLLSFSSLFGLIIAGIVISIAAQTGDLIESALKRRLDVKDSGAILPGHGGLLDRFDGYLLAVPLTYSYLQGFPS
ncbi:MAG: phosphatidate cytidylyltransferase [Candidatus Puniceispirillum sp.]